MVEGEDDDHDHRCHVDDKQNIGVDVRQHVPDRICDFLLLQLSLRFGNRQIVTLALVGRQHRQQDDGEHRQNNAEKSSTRLREGFVSRRRTGQTDDLGVDGVVAQQGRGRHGTKTGNKGHNGEREHRRDQRGENHLPQHLEWLGTHVAGSFHCVVIKAADGVAQKQHVV